MLFESLQSFSKRVQYSVFLGLICFLLASCGSTTERRLSYQVDSGAGQEEPNLVLVVRQDQISEDTFRFTPSFDTSAPEINFEAATIGALLQDCANHLGDIDSADLPGVSGDVDDCIELGQHVGEELLGGAAVSANPNADLLVRSATQFYFVMFIYRADDLSAGGERCVQLITVQNSDEGLQVPGGSVSGDILLQLDEKNSAVGNPNRNCFALS